MDIKQKLLNKLQKQLAKQERYLEDLKNEVPSDDEHASLIEAIISGKLMLIDSINENIRQIEEKYS